MFNEVIDRLQKFTNEDPGNQLLLAEMLSHRSLEDTLMITTWPITAQEIVNAMDNENKSQPKV